MFRTKIALVVLCLSFLFAPLALATTIPASVGVLAGTLSFVVPGSITFSGLTLSGINQSTTGTLAVDVKDATGSGTGWKVQGTSTQFKDTGSNTLPVSSTTINAQPTNVCDASTTCTLATTSGVTYPYTLPAAASAPTATTFFNAAANTGMGDQTDTSTFTVNVPANTLVPAGGAYTSTFTVTAVSGP